MRRPVRVCDKETMILRNMVRNLNIKCEFEIFVTDTVRGRCSYKARNLTVPLWAFNDKRVGYITYYVCHEIAHVMAPATRGNVHGPEFQKAFMSICPKEYQHYELNYKPRLAAAAGIKRKD